jgi:hypothetical protein
LNFRTTVKCSPREVMPSLCLPSCLPITTFGIRKIPAN